MELMEKLKMISPSDEKAKALAAARWNAVAKPLHSLGVLEEDIIKIAGMTGSADISLGKKALVVMCADNGIVEEGVTQTGREVTAIVTENFTKGDTCSCIMAGHAGADVFPVDIGVAGTLENCGSVHPLLSKKVMWGTNNFLKGPAMTREQAEEAVMTGIRLVEELKEEGYGIIAMGEMGIGNTTTSSAVACVLLGRNPEEVTGRGAGLSDQGLHRKISVIREGIRERKPDPYDGLDVLSKVGGLDLAGLAGVCLGGAVSRIPVVVDGFISGAAALAAAAICPKASDYMIASHVSAEPAGKMVLSALGLTPAIEAGMCLGEGTGALAFLPLLDMALSIYTKMSTFQDIHVEEYQEFPEDENRKSEKEGEQDE
ncbi:nicotinate-nucleotide--dimethylbenzimidazole phosphoribosyltransferase [Clostridium sp. AM58-1XD]|uniref:nicotinate-nucleotide--dimethylbenzimidazole phosphoribosyltransferase n=1 Tax=Clostridium sp. AM58-1XD TaxID=2292307 RepID=UPI000E47261F|nr:nicotinate-nucleotide--dimethylbenzimidazole phosphoribosyltransferase [Clostridium sp. AM58-1XD]RGZ00708.1 nicotinate-nucleotide--dimethylbenzimidazole phosphoribosyltransferase [Clostridium sp. AM58-1XD]